MSQQQQMKRQSSCFIHDFMLDEEMDDCTGLTEIMISVEIQAANPNLVNFD